jgi:putative hemolysin
VARTGEVLEQLGRRGLYTSTLFHYGREFLDRLGPAIELGRAFVKQEYQRSFAPLYLLWKGIGRLVLEKPQYTTLFGALSISSSYTDASRRLIVEFLKSRSYARKLAKLIKPHYPFEAGPVLDCPAVTI